jgi:hypothetical protein
MEEKDDVCKTTIHRHGASSHRARRKSRNIYLTPYTPDVEIKKEEVKINGSKGRIIKTEKLGTTSAAGSARRTASNRRLPKNG